MPGVRGKQCSSYESVEANCCEFVCDVLTVENIENATEGGYIHVITHVGWSDTRGELWLFSQALFFSHKNDTDCKMKNILEDAALWNMMKHLQQLDLFLLFETELSCQIWMTGDLICRLNLRFPCVDLCYKFAFVSCFVDKGTVMISSHSSFISDYTYCPWPVKAYIFIV